MHIFIYVYIYAYLFIYTCMHENIHSLYNCCIVIAAEEVERCHVASDFPPEWGYNERSAIQM